MKKPTWIVWIAGVVIFSVFYWLTGSVIHHSVDWHRIVPALEVGVAGGTLIWWFARRKWHKQQHPSI